MKAEDLMLGVPKNSANHYHGKDGKTHYIDGSIPCSLLWADGLVPCWSVGRLIEIISHCYNWNESLDIKFTGGCLGIPRYVHKDNYLGGAVGFIVREIGNAIMTNNMDFSKLED